MRLAASIALAWLALAAWHLQAAAQPANLTEAERQMPALFKADRVRYERELSLVVATGNVEITHGERILLADTLTYNQRTDIINASGNVRILDPSGDVFFAESTEISGDLKEGIAETIRIRLADDSRFAAVGARRIAGKRTEMRKAVYTPCLPCKEDPDRAPIWQVKAYEVVHDQENKEIEYTDAIMEIFGVPVFYLPYFSHPDPTVKRKTGFLVPSYGSDSELGAILKVPYFINLSPTSDVTLTPIFTSDEGPVIAGEYRKRFDGGMIQIQGSATDATRDDGTEGFRGNLDGRMKIDIDDTWRGGLKVDIASDDTYLRRYGFGPEDTLTSRAYVEGFRKRVYASANGYYFQGQREDDDSGQIPIVHPILDYNFISEPGRRGGRWSFDANLLALTRTEGTDSRRLSFKTGWELPYISELGDSYRLFASLQTDAYWTDDQPDIDNPPNTRSDVTGRFFPLVGLDWRFPFVRNDSGFSQMVEPIAGIILAPNGGNSDKIPNEDSLDFELDDTNVFRPNRFTGLDRVEGGQRLYFGLKGALYGPDGGYISAFIGQSYRLRDDDTFIDGTGLDGHFSDVIGRVQVSPNSLMDILYRFRFDNDNWSAKRNEVSAAIGPRALRLTTTYLFIDQGDPDEEFSDRQEITASLTTRLSPRWKFAASTRRDLEDDGGALFYRYALDYDDDCFGFGASFTRTFFEDRDIQPSDTLFFQLRFKHLGGFGAGSST